jgi:hypothetical protein
LKFKEVVDSILVHSIVAYIILTSFSKTSELFEKLVQEAWYTFILQAILFGYIAHILSARVTPYNQYSFKHPLKLIGNVFFFLVIIIFYNLDKNGVINLLPGN